MGASSTSDGHDPRVISPKSPAPPPAATHLQGATLLRPLLIRLPPGRSAQQRSWPFSRARSNTECPEYVITDQRCRAIPDRRYRVDRAGGSRVVAIGVPESRRVTGGPLQLALPVQIAMCASSTASRVDLGRATGVAGPKVPSGVWGCSDRCAVSI